MQAATHVRWDIDANVIPGREFDFSQTFLSAGLSPGTSCVSPSSKAERPVQIVVQS